MEPLPNGISDGAACHRRPQVAILFITDFLSELSDKKSQEIMSNSRNDCRIYVGNLPPDIRTKDIQDLFYKFGKVTFVDLKNRRGPPFAFVEFEDPRYGLFPL